MKPQITKLTLSLATILTLGATSIQAENILQNGSFEDFTVLKAKNNWKKVQLTNWNGETKVNRKGKTATDGRVKIALDSTVLEQTIRTIKGVAYTFSVDAYVPKRGLSTSEFEMIVDGKMIERFSPTTDWETYSVTFTGKGQEQSIAFKKIASQNNKSVFLDNAKLIALAPDATVTLNPAQKYKQKLNFEQSGRYVLENAPKGMRIFPNGTLAWTPTNDQDGDYSVIINVLNGSTIVESKELDFYVTNKNKRYDGVFVNLSGDSSGDGTPQNPYGTYKDACEHLNGKHNIYLRGGVYKNRGYHSDGSNSGKYPSVEAECQGTQDNPIVIRPWGNEYVKIKTDARYGIKIESGAKHITIQNLEIEGEAQKITLDDALKYWWWDNNDTMKSMGIFSNGDEIIIKDNIVHDMPGSGISASAGEYADIENNIVYNCDWWTIAGSKGIGITSAKGRNAKGKYRNKIIGNLIFNIEQRLFSHVWKKKNATLTIDEGEAFLIQEGKRQDNTTSSSYNGKYLIQNNIILYNGKTGVANLAKDINITNNTYYNNGGATKQSGFRISQTNHLIIENNAVESNIPDTFIYSSDKSSKDILLTHNYAKGEILNRGRTVKGIERKNQIFKDPDNFDFSIVSTLPQNIGANSTVIKDIKDKLELYNIKVHRVHMEVDRAEQTKYIVKNAPGEIDCSHYNDTKDPYIMIKNINPSHTLVKDLHTTKFKLSIKHKYGECRETKSKN